MTTTDQQRFGDSERYRNEAMALAAHPAAKFRVQIRHADPETFEDAVVWNQQVAGMAGLAVRNDDGDVLFIHHDDYGGWVMPGGRVEDGESFPRAAERETREESGVEADVVRPLFVFNVVTRHADESTDAFLVLFEGEARDPEPTDDLGEGGETITDVQWTGTIPDRLPDDAFVQRTTRLVANRFDTVESR
jgi:ADP-ribose pyrophosphatase YjhB (NUDIX family)